MAKEEPKPLEVAAAALARRDRSAADLRAELARRGVEPGEAAHAIERLQVAGYVDDERYAAARAEVLAARGYADAAIARELEQHGLDREQIGEALATLEPEDARAAALVERWGATSQAARRLRAKGFDADAVEAAICGSE